MPKILIKSLCKLKLNWDDEIIPDLSRRWLNWLKHVDCIKSLSWDSCLVPSTDYYEGVEVHAFSDAFSEAYASVLFLRVVYDDCVKVSFLVGKCKTAPHKETLTILKLELIAACLPVCLVQKVLSELHLGIHGIVY